MDAKGNHGAMVAAGAGNDWIWEQFFDRAHEFARKGLNWSHTNVDGRNVSGVCCHATGPRSIKSNCSHLVSTHLLDVMQHMGSVPPSSVNRRTTDGDTPGASKSVRDARLGVRSGIDGRQIGGWNRNAWHASSYGGGGGGAWQAASYGGGGGGWNSRVVCWRCYGEGHHAWACTS